MKVLQALALVLVIFASAFVVGYGLVKFTRPATETKTEPDAFIYESAPVAIQPPSYLLINAERWYAIPSTFKDIKGADPSTNGMTFCFERKIYYRFGLPNKAQIREVLWHEIEHASKCRPRSDDKDANWMPWGSEPTHHEIYLNGMFWADFAMSNPDFMKWASE